MGCACEELGFVVGDGQGLGSASSDEYSLPLQNSKIPLDDAQSWMDLVGPAGLLKEDEDGALAGGNFDEAFRQTPVNTIYGGTVEILRSLVAEVDLGLPKSR